MFVFLLVSLCQSFNVDTYEPIVRSTLQTGNYDDPFNKDMFGYRVALYNSSSNGIRYGLYLRRCNVPFRLSSNVRSYAGPAKGCLHIHYWAGNDITYTMRKL